MEGNTTIKVLDFILLEPLLIGACQSPQEDKGGVAPMKIDSSHGNFVFHCAHIISQNRGRNPCCIVCIASLCRLVLTIVQMANRSNLLACSAQEQFQVKLLLCPQLKTTLNYDF